jgi:hypothetical protein
MLLAKSYRRVIMLSLVRFLSRELLVLSFVLIEVLHHFICIVIGASYELQLIFDDIM